PLFAEVLAGAIGAAETVVEVGGGAGTLARDILAVRPGLEYVVVERSASLRALAAQHAPVAERMPDRSFDVAIANELLDNLPFDLFEFRDNRWWEVRVEDGEHEVLATTDVDIASLVPDLP